MEETTRMPEISPASWDSHCERLRRIGLLFSIVGWILIAGFCLATYRAIDLWFPLLTGRVGPGHPSYAEFQASKDIALIVWLGIFVLVGVNQAVGRRWLAKVTLALGRRPAADSPVVRELKPEQEA